MEAILQESIELGKLKQAQSNNINSCLTHNHNIRAQSNATIQTEQPVLLHQYKLNHCILSYEARATQKHKLTNIHKLRICTIPRKCKM